MTNKTKDAMSPEVISQLVLGFFGNGCGADCWGELDVELLTQILQVVNLQFVVLSFLHSLNPKLFF